VYKVWPDEIKKWEEFKDLTYAILHGPNKERNLRSDVDIYIINPEGLKWLFADHTKRPQFDVLCVDESTKFKDSQTQRFKLLKTHLPYFKRRWILTGTPHPNGLEDLFGQVYIMDLGRSLGRFITHFRNKFFERDGWSMYSWRPKHGAYQEVVEKISPLVIRLSAEDHLEMPSLISSTLEVELPPEAKRIYKEIEDDFITEVDQGTIVASNVAVAGVKCRQVANGAIYHEDKVIHVHDAKIDALEELIEGLCGKPVLVLYEFRHDLERIQSRFGPLPNLGSGVSPKRMEEIIDQFNAGRIPVLLGHPGSMAHGLNLQEACHHIIWFSIPWSLELYDQAVARVYRQGQQSDSVFVYHIVCKETLDETVMETLDSKDRTQQSLLRSISEYRKIHFD
jgi:SNF2 family DNA or RNA helicase